MASAPSRWTIAATAPATSFTVRRVHWPCHGRRALRLLDHLDIARADVIGYSMGARIAAFLALAHPERVRSAVFAGLGANMIHGVGDPKPIAAALLAEDAGAIADPNARGVPGVRRSDQERPACACRLHHGNARPHPGPELARLDSARACRGGHGRRHRGAGAAARGRDPRRASARHTRDAII